MTVTNPRELTDGAKAATCPFMRTMIVNNPDSYDDKELTMSRATLEQFVKNQRQQGSEGSLERVLLFFAWRNQTGLGQRLSNWWRGNDKFSTKFPGSRGDHPGSPNIYRRSDGLFDADAFQKVISNSANDATMTPADFAKAIIDANGSNHGRKKDLFKSAGEFALLFNLLGQADGAIRIDHMRALFENNEWPERSLQRLGVATLHDWLEMTKTIAYEIVRSKRDGGAGQELEGAMKRAMVSLEKRINRLRNDGK